MKDKNSLKNLLLEPLMIAFMIAVFLLTYFVSLQDKKIDEQKKEPIATTQQVPFVK